MGERYSRIKLKSGEYTLNRMPPTRALSFAPKVSALIAGALGGSDLEALRGAVGQGDAAGLDIVPMIARAIRGLDPETLTALMKEALEYEVYAPDGNRLEGAHFDIWFGDHPGDMMPVAAWAIWEHSKDFFTGGLESFQQVFLGAPASGSRPAGSGNTTSDE